MGHQHELEDLIERIDETDFGPAESELVRRALVMSSELGDDALDYRVRLRAMLSSSHHARFDEFIEHFASCLERHRSNPERFAEEDGGISVRAYQGSAVASLLRRTAAPLSAVHDVLEDFEEYLVQAGKSPRKSWELRLELALHRGAPDEARAWRDKLLMLPRPEGQWCAGCEVVGAAGIEEDEGSLASLGAALGGLEEHDPQCGNSRLTLAAMSPLPLAATGRGEDALDLHRWGSRESRRAGRGRAPELARHAAFAALASHPERAVALTGVALAQDAPQGLSTVARFETLAHAALALAIAQDEGMAEVPVRGTSEWLPELTAPRVAQAHALLESQLASVVRELDAHFGSDAFASRARRVSDLRTLRVEAPWAEAAPDLAPSGIALYGAGPDRAGTDAAETDPAETDADSTHGTQAGHAASGRESTPQRAGDAPAAAVPRTDQEWLDAVALPALIGDAERAGAHVEGAIASIQDPSTLLELYSEAIDVLPGQAPRWYAARAELFARVGMSDHAWLEEELRDLMVADRDAEAGDAPRWRGALSRLTTDAGRAEVLTHLSQALLSGGQEEEAAEVSRQAAALAHTLPSRGDALWVLGEAAAAASAAGRHDEALALSDQASELALVGERNALVWMHQRGLLLGDAQRLEESVGFLKRAADIAIANDLAPVAVHLLLQAGGRAYYLDNNVQAAAYLRLGRDLAQRSSDPRTGLITMRLAAALEDAGEPDEAARLLEEVLEWQRESPDDPRLADVSEGSVLRFLGDALAAAGDLDEAEAAWAGSLRLLRPAVEKALAAGVSPDAEQASDSFNAALSLARTRVRHGDPDGTDELIEYACNAAPHGVHAETHSLGEVEDASAQMLSMVGLHERALVHAQQARSHFLAGDHASEAADALDTQARILVSLERKQEGLAALLESAREFEAAGHGHGAARSRWLAARLTEDPADSLALLELAWADADQPHSPLRQEIGEALVEALDAAGRTDEARHVRGKID